MNVQSIKYQGHKFLISPHKDEKKIVSHKFIRTFFKLSRNKPALKIRNKLK